MRLTVLLHDAFKNETETCGCAMYVANKRVYLLRTLLFVYEDEEQLSGGFLQTAQTWAANAGVVLL